MSSPDTTAFPKRYVPETWQYELREWHRQVDDALEAFRREHGHEFWEKSTARSTQPETQSGFRALDLGFARK